MNKPMNKEETIDLRKMASAMHEFEIHLRKLSTTFEKTAEATNTLRNQLNGYVEKYKGE